MPIYEDKNFKDYVNSLPAATENDLAAGNNMPIVSASDVKKMGGENVAKGSVANSVNILGKQVSDDRTELSVKIFDSAINSNTVNTTASYNEETMTISVTNSMGGISKLDPGRKYRIVYEYIDGGYYECRVLDKGVWSKTYFAGIYKASGTIEYQDYVPTSTSSFVLRRPATPVISYKACAFDITDVAEDVLNALDFAKVQSQIKYVFVGAALAKGSDVAKLKQGTLNNYLPSADLSSGSSYDEETFVYTSSASHYDGFKILKDHEYKIILTPLSDGMYRCRTLYDGVWKVDFFSYKTLEAGVPIAVSIKPVKDSTFVFCKQEGGITLSYKVVAFDVTDIGSSAASSIDCSTLSSSKTYFAYDFQEKGVCSAAINAEGLHVDGKHVDAFYKKKKIACLGDSITAGGTWQTFVDFRFGFSSVINCGQGGTRISGSGSSCFYQDGRVNAIPLDTDVVTILGGTNDYSDPNLVIGEASRTNHDVSTLIGAYNVLVSKIFYKFGYNAFYDDVDYSGVTRNEEQKDINIFLITCPFMGEPKSFDTNYSKLEAVAEATKKVGALWGLPVADIYNKSGINKITWPRYLGRDKVHPSVYGGKKIASVVIGTMLECEPVG